MKTFAQFLTEDVNHFDTFFDKLNQKGGPTEDLHRAASHVKQKPDVVASYAESKHISMDPDVIDGLIHHASNNQNVLYSLAKNPNLPPSDKLHNFLISKVQHPAVSLYYAQNPSMKISQQNLYNVLKFSDYPTFKNSFTKNPIFPKDRWAHDMYVKSSLVGPTNDFIESYARNVNIPAEYTDIHDLLRYSMHEGVQKAYTKKYK